MRCKLQVPQHDITTVILFRKACMELTGNDSHVKIRWRSSFSGSVFCPFRWLKRVLSRKMYLEPIAFWNKTDYRIVFVIVPLVPTIQIKRYLTNNIIKLIMYIQTCWFHLWQLASSWPRPYLTWPDLTYPISIFLTFPGIFSPELTWPDLTRPWLSKPCLLSPYQTWIDLSLLISSWSCQYHPEHT